MRKDIKLYVQGCIVCQKVNRRTTLAYSMLGKREIPQVPFQAIYADHLSLSLTKSGNSYILAHYVSLLDFLLLDYYVQQLHMMLFIQLKTTSSIYMDLQLLILVIKVLYSPAFQTVF